MGGIHMYSYMYLNKIEDFVRDTHHLESIFILNFQLFQLDREVRYCGDLPDSKH